MASQGRGGHRGHWMPTQNYGQRRGAYQSSTGESSWNEWEVSTSLSYPSSPADDTEVLAARATTGYQARWLPRAQGSTRVESTVLLGRVGDGEYQREPSQDRLLPMKGTLAQAQLRATFYPKFENEKSDQEIRIKMIEAVQSGRGVLEVSLKHSGSLFMYSGDNGGAFAKNSFGNLYTAVGVFVLGRTFQESWGAQAAEKQSDFNAYLETYHLCISMELVTAVLGDHGQRPQQDYVVVTAIADLESKPRFYSTPDLIAFCRQWRLPTNHVWLFSSRTSAISFFTAYDVLCEEGTASAVSKILDEISDVSVPATKSHVEVQGEILEGLVARIVPFQSTGRLQKVLEEFPLVNCKESDQVQLGHSLREICAEHKASEKQQVEALLQSVGPHMCSDWSDWLSNERNASLFKKFLKAVPVNQMTSKLQEMIRVIQERNMKVRFPCCVKGIDTKEQKAHFKLTVHVLDDFVFRKYQKEMRMNPELWPLYRGFFVDVSLFDAGQKQTSIASLSENFQNNLHVIMGQTDVLADESENLMLKLKFLPYKIRTFLIRNGLSTLFRSGFPAYRKYYLRQMEIWGTSIDKQQQLDQLLTEWAQYIMNKYVGRRLDDKIYLSEAELFLEKFAKRSWLNQKLVGFAGTTIRTEGFLSKTANEGEHIPELEGPLNAKQTSEESEGKGMIVFFPGIPGCGKSALCKELLRNPGGLADGKTMHTLMGDLVKGRYWPQLAEERRRQTSPTAITLADKNAPNVEVWKSIQNMCQSTSAIGVPVVPDSQGADLNPFSLEVLALFMYRVLQRVNHPGNLDKNSPNAGYVLLMFYNLYEGKDRKEFEENLKGLFGYLVKLPILKENSPTMPSSVLDVIKRGLALFRRHTERHARLDSTKGAFREEWSSWEKELREVLDVSAAYFKAVQVPFEEAVQSLQQQLLAIARGDVPMNTSMEEQRSFKSVTFAAVSLPGKEIIDILQELANSDKELKRYFLGKGIETILKASPHVTLAHKYAHGVAAVAAFGEVRGLSVPVELTALFFSKKMCALEARILANGISSRNEWPHVTVWTAPGTKPKETNFLPQLVDEGQAFCVQIKMPVVVSGVVELL